MMASNHLPKPSPVTFCHGGGLLRYVNSPQRALGTLTGVWVPAFHFETNTACRKSCRKSSRAALDGRRGRLAFSRSRALVLPVGVTREKAMRHARRGALAAPLKQKNL